MPRKRSHGIHTDYSQVQIDILSETKMWKAYDYIASISEAVTKEFLKKFPTLKNRIILNKKYFAGTAHQKTGRKFFGGKRNECIGDKNIVNWQVLLC